MRIFDQTRAAVDALWLIGAPQTRLSCREATAGTLRHEQEIERAQLSIGYRGLLFWSESG